VANVINSVVTFARVSVDEGSEFCIQTSLLLGDGACLDSQVTALATVHLRVLDELVPILARLVRGEITFDECRKRVDLMAVLSNARPGDILPAADDARPRYSRSVR
jgi:hypothetical protein